MQAPTCALKTNTLFCLNASKPRAFNASFCQSKGRNCGSRARASIDPRIRSFKVRASTEGDIEDVVPSKFERNSSGHVFPYVGVACLGAILFGYHLGVVNGAMEYLAKDLGIAANTALQGWVVSALLGGATVGSFTGGTLADKFGRTKTFILDAIPLAIGAFLCTTAKTIEVMIAGRLLAGFGVGLSSAIVPLYISEISPTEIRGTLGSVNQLSVCIGVFAALVAGLPLAGNPSWWRTMFGIALVPSFLLALGMMFSPESPRWLFQQGKFSQAEMSIQRLFGKDRVPEIMNDLKKSAEGASEPEAGWLDLFSSRYGKVVSVGAALFIFQQLAGINAVVYYSTAVFQSAGITSDVAASALVGASNVFGSAVASLLMDKQGRKSLLLISFSGMVVIGTLNGIANDDHQHFQIVTASYTYGGILFKYITTICVAVCSLDVFEHLRLVWGEFYNPAERTASMLLLSLSFTWKVLAPYSGTLAVVGTVLYVLSFSLGAGPVPPLLLPEIFASRIRAKAVALSLGMHWMANFVIGLYFLSFVTKFGISTAYLGFASVCAVAVWYITGNVVETKGLSLEEIERRLSPAA